MSFRHEAIVDSKCTVWPLQLIVPHIRSTFHCRIDGRVFSVLVHADALVFSYSCVLPYNNGREVTQAKLYTNSGYDEYMVSH
jgi:hypothetical protein